MRTQSLVSVLAAAAVASAQTAPVVSNNPIGAQYLAELPDKNTTTARGSVQIQSAADGKGVDVSVSISGLPDEGGPFMYHIHEKPVPADGNCTATGAHLDPYKAGESPPCDKSKPETCQTGDLSGKHGNITEKSFSAKYSDAYLATLSSDPSFFGSLSVVVHLSNKTRISCANFKLKSPGAGPSSGYALPTGTGSHNGTVHPSGTGVPSGTGSGSGSGSSGPSATPTVVTPSQPPAQTPPPTGAGQKLVAGAGAVVVAAAALML